MSDFSFSSAQSVDIVNKLLAKDKVSVKDADRIENGGNSDAIVTRDEFSGMMNGKVSMIDLKEVSAALDLNFVDVRNNFDQIIETFAQVQKLPETAPKSAASVDAKINEAKKAMDQAISEGLDPLVQREDYIRALQDGAQYYLSFDSKKSQVLSGKIAEQASPFIERLAVSAGEALPSSEKQRFVERLKSGYSTEDVWVDIVTKMSTNSEIRKAEAALHVECQILMKPPFSKTNQNNFVKCSDQVAQVYEAQGVKNSRYAQIVLSLKDAGFVRSAAETIPASLPGTMKVDGNTFIPPQGGFSPMAGFDIREMGAFVNIQTAALFASEAKAAERTGQAAVYALNAAYKAASKPADFQALAVFAQYIVGPAKAAELDKTYNKPSSQAPSTPAPSTPVPSTPVPSTPAPSVPAGLAKAIDAYNAGIGNDSWRLSLKNAGNEIPELRMELAEIYSQAYVGRGLSAAEKVKYAPLLTPQATTLQMLEAIGDITWRSSEAATQEWRKQHPNPTSDETEAFLDQVHKKALKLISDALKAPAPVG